MPPPPRPAPHGRCRRYRGSTMARAPRPALRALSFFWALSFFRVPLSAFRRAASRSGSEGENPRTASGGGGGEREEEGRLLGLAAGRREGAKIASAGLAAVPLPLSQPPHTVLDPAQASAKALVKILREALPRAVVKSRYTVVVSPLVYQGNQYHGSLSIWSSLISPWYSHTDNSVIFLSLRDLEMVIGICCFFTFPGIRMRLTGLWISLPSSFLPCLKMEVAFAFLQPEAPVPDTMIHER